MKPFYIDGLTDSAYHAAPGWSSSQIRLLPKDPLTFRNRHLCRRDENTIRCLRPLDECQCLLGPKFDSFTPTEAMKLGTALHRVLLDGAEIEVIPSKLLTPSGARPTGAKTLPPLLEWEAEHWDSVHVTKKDSPLHRMVASVHAEERASGTINSSTTIRERSIWWEDSVTGLLCKARIDIWYHGYELVDLKTTRSPRPGKREFGGEIAAYQLDRQIAWYCEAAMAVYMVPEKQGFIAVGNQPPYECWYHEIDDALLNHGWQLNVAARKELAAGLESGYWLPEGYGEPHPAEVPDWYIED
jgi:hypothetical protein